MGYKCVFFDVSRRGLSISVLGVCSLLIRPSSIELNFLLPDPPPFILLGLFVDPNFFRWHKNGVFGCISARAIHKSARLAPHTFSGLTPPIFRIFWRPILS